MHCYYHQTTDAVAICQNCGRAACGECCRDTRHGVACSDSCVSENEISYQIDSRVRQSMGIGAKPPMPPSVSTYFLFGAILAFTGVYFSLQKAGIDFLTFALAAVFFVMSAVAYRQYRSRCNLC